MKKKLLCVLLGISMIGTMPGVMANAEEPATEAESILTGNYEKQHREVKSGVPGSGDFLCGQGWQRGIAV
ncbi:MAG: hypothetical protein ACLTSZ_04640 [Lachnospiraceae bacterium]